MSSTVFIVLVALLCMPLACLGQCILELDIANTTSLQITGSTVRPLVTPILVQGSPAFSLEGSVFLELEGSCPASADPLQGSLQGASLVAYQASPIALLPATVNAQVGTTKLAGLQISGITLNLTSDPLHLDLGSASNTTELFASITNGSVLVQTSLEGGANKPASMIGASANSSATITAKRLQGNMLEMGIMNLNFTFGSAFTLGSIAGYSSYFLAGNITAQGPLDSVAAPSSANPVQVPSALSAAALVPSLAPSSQLPTAGMRSVDSMLSPSPAPETGQAQSAIRPLGCLHGLDSSCSSCSSGWTGPDCDVCLSDDACNADLGTQDAVCNTSSQYTAETVFKSYKCDINGSVLGTVLSSFAFACNTTPVADSSGRVGGYCQVGLKVQSARDNPATCVVTDCVFKDGSSKVQCKDAACSCAKGTCPVEIQSYANLINGNDVEVDCDTNGECTVIIANFPVQVQLPCSVGDCQSPTNPVLFTNGAAFSSAPRSNAAVVAAIPLMLLAVLALVATGSSIATTPLWQRSKTLAAMQETSRLPDTSDGDMLRISQLEFSMITCTVKGSRWSNNQHHAAATPEASQLTRGSMIQMGDVQEARGKIDEDKQPAVPLNASNGLQNKTDASVAPKVNFKASLYHMPSTVSEKMDGLLVHGDGCGVYEPLPARRMDLLAGARACLQPRPVLTIVKGVSGVVRAGELVGILGPSGSGKTTLLSILADSTTALSSSSNISGYIYLNGQPRDQLRQAGLVAYVPQNDHLFPTLTVREALWYSCQLRLPSTSSAATVEQRVSSVLEELGLCSVADSQIGGSFGIRGISGGERRRTSIGMEMVTYANLLLLDEPTSGLDSFTASKLLLSLQQIAHSGRLVLLSIHQPGPLMFSLLDRCYLMCQGLIAFLGRPSEAEPFLLSAGLPCPPGTSIAEHMIAAVTEPDLRECLLGYVDQNGCCLQPAEEADLGQVLLSNVASASLSSHSSQGQRQRTGLVTELAVLSWRTFVDIWRNPSLLLLHMLIAAVMGVFVGAIFKDLTPDIAGAQGRLGAIFFVLCISALTSLSCVDLLVAERGTVVHELQAKYYSPLTYYLAKATLDAILLRVLPTIVFAIPLYYMAKLRSGAIFFVVSAVFAAALGGLCMAVTVGFNTAGKASLVMNILLLVQLLFAGYLKDISSITPVLRWLHFLSAFSYGFEALVISELEGIVFNFNAGPGISATVNGDTFLSAVHLQKHNLMRDVALLDALYAAFLCLGIALLYLNLPRPLRLRKP